MAESKCTRHEVQFRGVPNALRPRHDVNLLRGGRVGDSHARARSKTPLAGDLCWFQH